MLETRSVKIRATFKAGKLSISARALDSIRAVFGYRSEAVPLFVTITTAYDKASDDQRGYYFGVLVKEIAHCMRDAGNYFIDPDDSKDLQEIHRYLTELFAAEHTGLRTHKGEILPKSKSISRHDTVDQELFHDKIRQWAKDTFNKIIPLPNGQY